MKRGYQNIADDRHHHRCHVEQEQGDADLRAAGHSGIEGLGNGVDADAEQHRPNPDWRCRPHVGDRQGQRVNVCKAGDGGHRHQATVAEQAFRYTGGEHHDAKDSAKLEHFRQQEGVLVDEPLRLVFAAMTFPPDQEPGRNALESRSSQQRHGKSHRQGQIDDACAQGARLLVGGKVETLGGGLYLRPTVLTDVTPDMKLMREETFGPVIPVTLFDNVDEAIALANSGDYGLSGAVLAGSVEEAEAVGAQLCVGAVSINDGSLTGMVWEAEKSSFGLSGLGASRMGDSGLLRFFRRQALIRQSGMALPLAAYAEDQA